jgi:hypothetical protein
MTSIYSTGTVSVTNGSAVVTGSGTAWEVALVTGGSFSYAGMSIPIVSVDSDTSLTLAYPWPGATAAGAAYAIQRENSDAANVVDLYDKLTRVLIQLSLVGIHPNNSGSLAKRNALALDLDDDNYLFLRAEIGVEFAFYRWDGPSLSWIGPFPVASAIAAAAGVNSIVAGLGVSVDNTNPDIPVVGLSGVVNKNAATLPAPHVTGTVLQLGGADSVPTRLLLDGFGTAGNFNVRRANGTAAARTALVAGDAIANFGAFGAYDATNYSSGVRAYMQIVASENWTAAAQGAEINCWTTPNGGTATRLVGRFTQDGRLVVSRNAATIASPGSGNSLHLIGADGEFTDATIDAYAAVPTLLFRRANGTGAAPSPILSGHVLGTFAWRGFGISTFATSAQLRAYAVENHTEAARGTSVQILTTPAGTTTPVVAAEYSHNGDFYPTRSIVANVNPATAPALNVSGGSVSLASGAELILSPNSGLLVLNENVSLGRVGTFMCGGGVVAMMSGSDAIYVNSNSPSTSQIGVYFDAAASRYKVKNGFTTTKSLGVMWLATRASV